jgi:hypothetical protein
MRFTKLSMHGLAPRLVRSAALLTVAANVLSACTAIYLISIKLGGQRTLAFELFDNTVLISARLTGAISILTLRIVEALIEDPNAGLVIVAAAIGSLIGLFAGVIAAVETTAAWRPSKTWDRFAKGLDRTLLSTVGLVTALLVAATVAWYDVFELVPSGVYLESITATTIAFLIIWLSSGFVVRIVIEVVLRIPPILRMK